MRKVTILSIISKQEECIRARRGEGIQSKHRVSTNLRCYVNTSISREGVYDQIMNVGFATTKVQRSGANGIFNSTKCGGA